VRAGLVVGGRFGDQHEILDQGFAHRLGHQHHQVHIVRARHQHGCREQLLGIGDDAAQRRPVGEVDAIEARDGRDIIA
jgi:hypothetical protein